MGNLKRSLTYQQQVNLTAIQQQIILAVHDNDMARLLELQQILFNWVLDQIDDAIMKEITPLIKMNVKN